MTVKEAEYFVLNGINSQDYGIINCSVSSGLYEEMFLPEQEISEIKIRGREKPYLVEVSKKSRELNLSFAFTDTWDDDLIRKVARWIGSNNYYVPLYFSSNPSKIYYVLYEGDIKILHNGLKNGYLDGIKFRCSDPYIYSPTYKTQTYTTGLEDIAEDLTDDTLLYMTNHGLTTGDYIMNLNRNNAISQVTVFNDHLLEVSPAIDEQTAGDLILKYSNRTIEIELTNLGDETICPCVEFYKIGKGDISVRNLTDEGKELKFTNIDPDVDLNETISVDCENEIIITDKQPEIYRYKDHNGTFLNLIYGINKLQITGNLNLFFRYNFKFLT